MRASGRSVIRGAAILAAVVAVLAIAAPVAAAPAQSVTIVSNVTFNPNGPNFGDFAASGPAVDQGLICPAGTFVDTGLKFSGFQSRTGHVQLQVVKAFTCSDGSGTFAVKLQINADFNTGIEHFTWVAAGTSGDVASLQGAGTGSTVPTDTGNINTYVGTIAG